MNDDVSPRRRVAAVVASATTIAAVGVGAYVLNGDNHDSAAPTTTVSTTVPSTPEATDPIDVVAATEPEANAGGPVPTTVKPVVVTTTTARAVTTTTQDAAGGARQQDYAANRPLIAVSPVTVRAGKPVEFEIKRFPKRTRLTVAVLSSRGATVLTVVVTTTSEGTAKGRFIAPARGSYTVTATAVSPAATASTRLTVS